MEEGNKYWIEESRRKCIFFGKDNLGHYVKDFVETKIKFTTDLGKKEKEIFNRI